MNNAFFPVSPIQSGVSPRSVVANVLDCEIVVSEFKLQSYYYVLFRTNTLGKNMNHISSLAVS